VTIYPGGVDSFTGKVDGVDDVMAADINDLQAAVAAIETELGADPAGSCTDVVTRLDHTQSAAGMLELDAATELTISSGAITVTQNFHTIDTQSDAATDDLDTISGGTDGMIVVFRLANAARAVVFKHATGNIYCYGDANITLSKVSHTAWCVYDDTLDFWIVR
jgi:hypothetical protein